MLLSLAARRQVLFVSGKGGVGKTSVASAVALARATAGVRVLLVSTDPAHNLGHVWDRSVGDEPTPLVAGLALNGLEIDAQRTVDRHLAAVRATMLRLLPERLAARADEHLAAARAAPGTHESAVLERLAEALEDAGAGYDLVVVDTAPSGHTLRLMALPEQLTLWTEALLANRDRSGRFEEAVLGLGGRAGGLDPDDELRRVLLRRRHRFAALRDVVGDPERTAFALVLTAERLPVLETLAMHDQLSGLGVPVGGLVVNRRSPSEAGDLLAARREQEEHHLGTLRARLPGVPLQQVPLLPGDLVGEEALGRLVAALDPPEG